MSSELHVCIYLLNNSKDMVSVPTWRLWAAVSVSHIFWEQLTRWVQSLCRLTDRCIVSSARCFVTESVTLGRYISKLIFRIYLSNLWKENLSLFSPVLLNLCGVVCRALPVLCTLYFTVLLSAFRSICLVKGMYLSRALQIRTCAETSDLLGLWEGFFLHHGLGMLSAVQLLWFPQNTRDTLW